jgi:hypothetical protein
MEVEACGFTGCHILLSEKRTPYKSDEKRRKGRMREIERDRERDRDNINIRFTFIALCTSMKFVLLSCITTKFIPTSKLARSCCTPYI